MKTQNYGNHRRFYAPHHFVLLPAIFILLIYGLYKRFTDDSAELLWTLFSLVIFLILYLAIMLRQHYALVLQDRLLLTEFRQRYFEIFGTRSEDVVQKMDFSQIAALRFANDDEFKILLKRALDEKISGDVIKKSISHWKADNRRV